MASTLLLFHAITISNLIFIDRLKREIAIIGGGAAGIFCAILLSEDKNLRISIFEKSGELLKKVKISGGGRCNVTHRYSSPSQFAKKYPRGSSILKKNFDQFSPSHFVEWMERKGVKLKTEEDGRMFPTTDNSQTIIDLFLRELKKENVTIHFDSEITTILPKDGRIELTCNTKKRVFDRVILAMGGPQKERDLDFLSPLKIATISPAPSLFTFKIQDKALTDLMGLSVNDVEVKIIGSAYREIGPVLITHWGLSGPGILKLSAWAAFHLRALNYRFHINVNWLGDGNFESAHSEIQDLITKHSQAKVSNQKIDKIPNRLWSYFLAQCEIPESKKWSELSKKEIHRLIDTLIRSEYNINGKTTYKEEFVTAGGIHTDEIETSTMALKKHPNIFCIGEITNIDGITGGFNFQNCWTSAAVCANRILKNQF
jgi:predicted Rossmann fold flavoprotein